MPSLKIIIKPEHFRKATGWGSIDQCPLAVAFREHLLEGEVFNGVGAAMLETNKRCFGIPLSWRWGGNFSDYPADTITDLCNKAKISLEGIPTVELELVEV